MNTMNLCGEWQLTGTDERTGESLELKGHVPSSALSDLIAAGLAPKDVFFRDNAEQVQKYERFDWVYSRTFIVEKLDPYCVLQFERLDTYGDVYLNDTLVASVDNGLIAYEFDVSARICAGENRLEVRLYSPVNRVAGKKKRNASFAADRLYTRRVQCSYGWDWAQRFVTCGIGEVRLVTGQRSMAVRDVYVHTDFVDLDEVLGLNAVICAEAELTDVGGGAALDFILCAPDGKQLQSTRKFVAEPVCRLQLHIPDPQLWYPAGYGEQPLYTLQIKNGDEILNETTFGIRTIRVIQRPDSADSREEAVCRAIQNKTYDHNSVFSGFTVKVNEKRIFCMGGNWVPCEPFAADPEQRRDRIRRALRLAKQGGMNMIRVWGGGAFECSFFYEECSRLGLLVTQDLLMACGQYPEKEEWFLRHLRVEAEYAARLIRNQACLAWFNGDNENAVWGADFQADYSGRTGVYRAIWPVLNRVAPHTLFFPSSPYGGILYASNTVGTTHNTQFLSEVFSYIQNTHLEDYREKWKNFRARFIAEEPTMGSVSLNSLERFMTPEDIFGGDDSMWYYHTKGKTGQPAFLLDMTLLFAQKLLGKFRDNYDRYFKLKYLQYEWMRLSLEQARREQWFCSGVIYWMLNDNWPAAIGWSLLDYYLIPKNSYYAFCRGSSPLIISMDRQGEQLQVSVSSVCPEEQSAVLRVLEVCPSTGECRELLKQDCCIPANRATVCATFSNEFRTGMLLYAILKSSLGEDRTFYRPGALPICPAEVEWQYDREQGMVFLHASGYLQAVELEGKDRGAVFSDNVFSMLPGEERCVRILEGQPDKLIVTAYTIDG